MQLNEPAPDFELLDLQGVSHKLSDVLAERSSSSIFGRRSVPTRSGQITILLDLVANDGMARSSCCLSQRIENESVQRVAEAAKARRIPEVLMDSDHIVADLYEAFTTPHVFVIDREGILRYRGAVDDITFRRRQATRFFLQEAVEALLNGHLPAVERNSCLWLYHRA